jgi:exodeoxyribonuclease III
LAETCYRRSGGESGASRWSAAPAHTYWDYTQLRFPRREGMRIDFVLGSLGLAGRVTGALIDREERKGKGASDHAPVVVELGD